RWPTSTRTPTTRRASSPVPRRAAPARRSAGFTFLELMVVIAILSLLASIVVANMDNMSAPTRVRGAAREFGNQMMEMKQMATERGRALFLEIDVEHQRRRLIDPPSVVDVPDPRDPPPPPPSRPPAPLPP